MRRVIKVGMVMVLCGAAIGCNRDEGQRDLAGASTGPAIEINCAQKLQAGLSRFPSGVGDTKVDVACLEMAGTVGK